MNEFQKSDLAPGALAVIRVPFQRRIPVHWLHCTPRWKLDIRTLTPLDTSCIFESLKKTGKAVIADGGWKTCGFSSEISASIVENIFEDLKSPIKRVALPDAPAPSSSALEEIYYPDEGRIITALKEVMNSKIS